MHGSSDGQTNVDDVNCDFWRIKVGYVPGLRGSTQNIRSANPTEVVINRHYGFLLAMGLTTVPTRFI